jgi:hypothetical protein
MFGTAPVSHGTKLRFSCTIELDLVRKFFNETKCNVAEAIVMAYEGELLTYCPAEMFNFRMTYAVVVSGARLNPYGHMLLNTGGPGGTYFQVSDVYGDPRFMNEGQFQRYLRENNKIIVTVLKRQIPYPQKAQLKLEELLSRKWVWGAVVHNCESFVQEIIVAGGGHKIQTGLLPLPMNSTNQCTPW